MNAHVQIPTNIDGIEDELASRMSRGDDAVAQRIIKHRVKDIRPARKSERWGRKG